ncbi:MAG TPA: hypothetical protein VIO38_09620 [Rariglobus sp.]
MPDPSMFGTVRRPTPSPPSVRTALTLARLTWQSARQNGDTERAETARCRIDVLLDQMAKEARP